MANTPVKFLRSYSSALTAKLVSAGGTGTPNASGYACTNSNGLQTFTVAEALVGLFYVYVHDSNDEIAYQGYVTLVDTTAVHRITDEVLNIDGYNLEQAMRLALSALVGKVTASETSFESRAADDSKTRISATATADGDRTAVSLNAD